jgi:uncharacterized SAM-binding protein YcdF (DUF218 family)
MRRSRVFKLLLIFFVACFVGGGIFFINIDRWLIIEDEPKKSDLIICLGGGCGERIKKVWNLYSQGYGSFILLTGPEWCDKEMEELRLSVKKRFLEIKRVPNEVILAEHESRSTYDEAINVKKIMKEQKFSSAIIVSAPYHMRRARYIFCKVFKDSDIKFYFVPADVPWIEKKWWQTEEGIVGVVMEVLKLIYYWIKYR